MSRLFGIVALRGENPTNVAIGASEAARIMSVNAEPFDLSGLAGGTLKANPDGDGVQTATVDAAAGYLTGAAGASEDMTGEVDSKFRISVNGGTPVLVDAAPWTDCDSGAAIASRLQTVIRAATGGEETVTFETDHYKITSTRKGLTSSIEVLAADDHDCRDELGLGSSAVATQGTGDVNNLEAVMAAELLAVIASDMAGLVGSASGGKVVLTSDSVGNGSSMVIGDGTLNTALGFTEADTEYGAVGLGYGGGALPNTDYVVSATVRGDTSPGGKEFSWTNPTTTGFKLYCETGASVDEVGVTVDVDE